MNKLILVAYIDVANLDHENVAQNIERITQTISSPTNEYISFVVPVRNQETKIECINPKFITNEEMVKKFKIGLESIDKKFEKILNRMGPYKRETLIEKHT